MMGTKRNWEELGRTGRNWEELGGSGQDQGTLGGPGGTSRELEKLVGLVRNWEIRWE